MKAPRSVGVFICVITVIEILGLIRAFFIALFGFQIFRRLWGFTTSDDRRCAMLATSSRQHGNLRGPTAVISAKVTSLISFVLRAVEWKTCMSRSIGSNPRGDVRIASFVSLGALTGEFGLQKLSVLVEEGWIKIQLTLSRIGNHRNIALLRWLLGRPKHKKVARIRQPPMSMVFWIQEKTHW